MATKGYLNGFTQGIDQDTSVNKYSNNNYYDAYDLRLISRGSLSNGALTNLKGNELVIDFADSNLTPRILNHTTVKDDLVLFTEYAPLSKLNITTTLVDQDEITLSFDSFNYIFKIIAFPEVKDPLYLGYIYTTYNNSDLVIFFNTFTELTAYYDIYLGDDGSVCFLSKQFGDIYEIQMTGGASFTMEVTHGSAIFKVQNYNSASSLLTAELVYEDLNSTSKLNFAEAESISVVGRYETATIKKVYWANGIDELRFLNIEDDNSSKEANELNIIRPTSFGDISATKIMGGSYNVGVVYHAYQYFDKHGSESTISPVETGINLYAGKLVLPTSNIIADIGSSSRSGVNVTISGYSTDFDMLRLYSVFYDDITNVPSINIVSEVQIPTDGVDISIIDTGSFIGSIELSEFLNLNQTSYSPKIIQDKSNILFQGNINEITFNSDAIDNWDARTYRYDTTGSTARAQIFERILGPNSDGNTGAIDTDYHYITFTTAGAWTRTKEGGGSPTDGCPDSGTNWDISGVPNSDKYVNRTNNVYYNVNDTNHYSDKYIYHPTKTSTRFGGLGKNVEYYFYTSDSNDQDLMPGEVYRIGAVFFNTKGQSSFVKWIDDIKVPESLFGNNTESTLYVEIDNFPVDDDIAYYQIVRVKRGDLNSSIKSIGAYLPTEEDYTDSTLLRPRLDLTTIGYATTISDINVNVCEFISPETMFNNPSNNNIVNYSLRTVGVATMTEPFTYYTNLAITPIDISESRLAAITKSFFVDPLNKIADASDIKKSVFTDTYYMNQFNIEDVWYSARSSGLITYSLVDLFDTLSPTYDAKYAIVALVKDLDLTRYNGIGNENISKNEFIKFSKIYPIAENTATCVYGDVFSDNDFVSIRSLHYIEDDSTLDSYLQILNINSLNSTVNTTYRSDTILNGYPLNLEYLQDAQETVEDGIALYPTTYDESIGDLYKYNSVFSKENDANKYYVKPLNFNEEYVNSTKILASDKKINSETSDSWTRFYSNDFIEVDAQYGDLTSLNLFKNNLFFFQENGFGILSVNIRSLIQDDNLGALSLGTGGILDRYDYISNFSGVKYAKDIIKTKTALYYIDRNDKKMYKIPSDTESISETLGVDSYFFDNITSSSTIKLGYDVETNEVLVNLNDDDFSLCYNETINSFTSKYLFNPTCFISTPEMLLSQKINFAGDTITGVFRHNSGEYGVWYKEVDGGIKTTSKVTLIINPNGNTINSFDNIDLRTEVYSGGENTPTFKDLVYQTVDRIKYSNSYINEISVEANTSDLDRSNVKRLIRGWRTQVPLTANSNRFFDTYLMLTLEFDNNSNKLFKLHDVITYFREAKY